MSNTKNFAQLAREFADSLEENGGNLAEVKERRNYWRQRAGEARGLVRDMDKRIDEALKTLNEVQAEIKAQRRTWIGPKVPPKVYQAPCRSN